MTTRMSDNLESANAQINARLKDIVTGDLSRFMQSALDGISLHTAPFIPIDTSDLINSETQEVVKTASGFEASIEYLAEYAAFVHEAPGTLLGKGVSRGPGKGAVWSPSGEPQYLVKGAQSFIDEDLDNLVTRFLK